MFLLYPLGMSAIFKAGAAIYLLHRGSRGPVPKAIIKVPKPTVAPQRKPMTTQVKSLIMRHQRNGIFVLLGTIKDTQS